MLRACLPTAKALVTPLGCCVSEHLEITFARLTFMGNVYSLAEFIRGIANRLSLTTVFLSSFHGFRAEQSVWVNGN